MFFDWKALSLISYNRTFIERSADNNSKKSSSKKEFFQHDCGKIYFLQQQAAALKA